MTTTWEVGDERRKLELYDDALSMMEILQEAVYALVNGEATVERDVTVDGEQFGLRVSWGDDDYLCLNR